jgi:hypothetical protein
VHQKFHGLGQVPIEFPEIESTYTAEEAKAEAARCFRCDAETGSADYTVGSRESIFAMARIEPGETAKQVSILDVRLENRANPFDETHLATLDDLVFLPANLSRLVIDPYREGCVTATRLGAKQTLHLDIPFTVTGFDDAPNEIREAVAKSIAQHGAAYIGARPIGAGARWIQVVDDTADAAADALVFDADRAIADGGITRAAATQPAGLLVNAANVRAAVDFALEQQLDFLLLDPTNALPGLAGELAGAPDISILNRAVRRLRELDREEEVDLVYFGGLRTGTDSAKMLALGTIAVTVGASMALALGADISSGDAVYSANLDAAEREQRSSNLLQAFTAEASMMARCTGKTNVQNLEPEDLRAITLVVSHAAGVPMAGSLHQH